MEFEAGGDIDIGDPVAISQAEAFAIQILGHPTNAPAGLGVFTRINQRNGPGFGSRAVIADVVLGQINGDVGGVENVIGEVFLDHVAAITEADHEIGDPVMTVEFHDVPQDRPAADLDHGLGPQPGFFRKTRAAPTCQNHRFHASALRLAVRYPSHLLAERRARHQNSEKNPGFPPHQASLALAGV